MIRIFFTALFIAIANLYAADPEISEGEKSLPMQGEAFKFDGSDAFMIVPLDAEENIPWVWYAPTLKGLPSNDEKWMFEKFLENGIAIAGIDIGESYGSPKGRATYSSFYDHLVEERKFRNKPCLLVRSRGGLMLYNWAVENPDSVAGVAGIYPVCNIISYPGIAKASGAYGLTPEELEAELVKHNPIDRLEPLAKAKVPILHLHGDADKLVPLDANSAELGMRYAQLGGSVEIDVIEGQGHNMWEGWFKSEKLTDFTIACALGEEFILRNPVGGQEHQVHLEGNLEGGVMAIGGETTGWVLNFKEGGEEKSIEVDMSAIDLADIFGGKDVKIAGEIISKQYTTRGTVLVLKAAKIQVDQ